MRDNPCLRVPHDQAYHLTVMLLANSIAYSWVLLILALMLNETLFLLLRYSPLHVLVWMDKMNQWIEGVSQWIHFSRPSVFDLRTVCKGKAWEKLPSPHFCLPKITLRNNISTSAVPYLA